MFDSIYSYFAGSIGNFGIFPYYMPMQYTAPVKFVYNPNAGSIWSYNSIIPDYCNIDYRSGSSGKIKHDTIVDESNPEKVHSKPKRSDGTHYNSNTSGQRLKPGLFKGVLAGKEDLITRICNKYNVPVGLVASILGLESGWGTSELAHHNNFAGYRAKGDAGVNDKGYGYFSSVEKGLDVAIRNIASYPRRFSDVHAVDFDNLDAIGRHYCEGSKWASRIRNVYNTRVKQYLV